MLLASLILALRGVPSADLTPPFYANQKNRIGYWEVSGSAIVHEDFVLLTPPIQERHGAVWNTLPPPHLSWSLNVSLQITSGTGGGGFGLFLIDEFGGAGDFYGGPSVFTGVAAVGAVFINDSGVAELKVALVSSNSSTTFAPFSEHASYDQIHLLSSAPFTVQFAVTASNFSFSAFGSTITTPLPVDISRCWFGVTAGCDDYTSRVDLLGVAYAQAEYLESLKADSLSHQGARAYRSAGTPRPSPILRNPSFSSLKAELRGLREGAPPVEKDALAVLAAVEEIGGALADCATYAGLSALVGRSLTRITQFWYRRAFKVGEICGDTRSHLVAAMHDTVGLLADLNSSVSKMRKTDRKLVNLTEFLGAEFFDGVALPDVATDQFWWMRYFVLGELLFAAVLLTSVSVPRLRPAFLDFLVL
jgi:hypothetical protein